MSVGLTYKSVSITPSTTDTVKSKKLGEIFDHSPVNLMVACTSLILSRNDFNLFSPCSHKKNMSSIYRHHKYGLYSREKTCLSTKKLYKQKTTNIIT